VQVNKVLPCFTIEDEILSVASICCHKNDLKNNKKFIFNLICFVGSVFRHLTVAGNSSIRGFISI